jgi:S1-C subfamily serine protease
MYCWLIALLLCAVPEPIVRVESVERGSTSWGTGTCVASTNESLIITAWHVIRDGHEFKIDGKPAKLIKADKTWDLAALTISGKLPTFNIGTVRPQIGETLTVCGFGSGDYKESRGQVTQYVSPGGSAAADIIECTAKARNGDSGGPIFDEHGTLVAVLFGTDRVGAHGSCTIQVRKFIEGLDIDAKLKEQALMPPYVFYGKTPIRARNTGKCWR